MWKCAFRSRWLIIATLAALCGCSTNPITGRSQFALVSEKSAISSSASAYSSMIGQLSQKGRIETGTPRVERVKEITNRLIAEAVRFRPDSATWNWNIVVINEPKTVNAFCMAGGKMGIYTGFWDKFQASDDEIANVMGHEIGHALASHTAKKMSVAIAAGIGAVVAAGLASRHSNDPSAFQRNRNTAEIAAALAITLPNSREAESEADQIGIELAARAGFDPRAAVSLWKKMAEQGGTPLEFFSTHPSPENRMQRLEALVARVDPLYRLAKEGKSTSRIPTFVSLGSNEREVGGVSREEYAARVSAEPQVMTFVAEDFEKFKNAEVVFSCRFECALSYSYQKGDWKKMHEAKAWRDLAVSILKVGYLNDLSYFLLGEAASGLNMGEAAKTYYARAIDAQKADYGCAGDFNTCEGFDVQRLALKGVTDMQASLDMQRAQPRPPVSPSHSKPQDHAALTEALPAGERTPRSAPEGDPRYADLMTAVSSSDKSAVNHFIARGADINERKGGLTYLIAAVINGDMEMVRFLVSKGADVNQVDSRGLPPIVYANAARPPNAALSRYLEDAGAKNPFAAR